MTSRIVVTGASGGIGAACVEAFQAEGAEVVGIDLETSSDADEHLVVDLESPECGLQIAGLLGERPLHGLVNNAALQINAPADAASAEAFDRIYAVNLRAPLLVSAAIRPALKQSRGFIVNVASVHAVATSKNVSLYAATKGGLVAMTRALAVEWGPEVRVNAVLPGAIETEMLLDGFSRSGNTIEDLAKKHPLDRIGQPSEVAEAVVFLAHNKFATGTTLILDGGATSRLSTE